MGCTNSKSADFDFIEPKKPRVPSRPVASTGPSAVPIPTVPAKPTPSASASFKAPAAQQASNLPVLPRAQLQQMAAMHRNAALAAATAAAHRPLGRPTGPASPPPVPLAPSAAGSGTAKVDRIYLRVGSSGNLAVRVLTPALPGPVSPPAARPPSTESAPSPSPRPGPARYLRGPPTGSPPPDAPVMSSSKSRSSLLSRSQRNMVVPAPFPAPAPAEDAQTPTPTPRSHRPLPSRHSSTVRPTDPAAASTSSPSAPPRSMSPAPGPVSGGGSSGLLQQSAGKQSRGEPVVEGSAPSKTKPSKIVLSNHFSKVVCPCRTVLTVTLDMHEENGGDIRCPGCGASLDVPARSIGRLPNWKYRACDVGLEIYA